MFSLALQSAAGRQTERPGDQRVAICQQRPPSGQHHWLCAQCRRLLQVRNYDPVVFHPTIVSFVCFNIGIFAIV